MLYQRGSLLSFSFYLKNHFKLILVINLTSFLFFGCKASTEGFAPGRSTINPLPGTPTSPTNPNQAFLKNGSSTVTANGWGLQIDTSDSIHSKTTANGWKIEVKYE